MRCRAFALLAIAGCSSPEPAKEQPPPAWTYAPAPVAFVGDPIARIGRSQAPQAVSSRGIEGPVTVPLRSATPMTVPGGADGKARAVLYGVEGVRSAIDLIDVDAGRVIWRDTTACAGPVVGVTEHAIVCADAKGVRGVGMDGKPKWKIEAAFLAITEDRVVVEGPGEAVIVDAASGDELSRVKLPKDLTSDAVLASCGDAGRELIAQGQDGKLVRIADAKGGSTITWATPVGKIDELEACEGNVVLVREAGIEGGTLVAIDRATGKVTGRIERVRGHWKARDGSGQIEVATAMGLATWSRDLVGSPVMTSMLVLGDLIDARGDRRLVRGSAGSAVLLDRQGVRAYVPFSAMGAVLGDTAIVRASWLEGELPRRIEIPPRYRKQLRIPAERAGVAVPAELRDLPEAAAIDPAKAIEQPETAMFGVMAVEIDPDDSAVLYTLNLEKSNEETNTAGIAAIDLAKRAWRWHRADACGTGEVVGMAVARGAVVCASRTRTAPTALVRATSREGAPRWEWETDYVLQVAGGGGAVLVYDADVMTVLDAETGKPRWRITSNDGGHVVAAAVAVGPATYVVAAERGSIVVRTVAGWPLWSIAVAGTVRAIEPAGAGVLVALHDGDAYRIELPTGTVHAMPGLGLTWHGGAEIVVADTAGGPIPGKPVPPTRPLRVLQPILKKPPADEDPERPRMWTPIPAPPPLGDSLQVTIFELTGGVRTRNDYGLIDGLLASTRGPAGSPVVLFAEPAADRASDVLAIDPRTGDPLRRVQLPSDAPVTLVFGTIVDGTPVAGAVLQSPLRVVLF